MDDYSFNQIKKMEQEALKRARQAQERAKPPENNKRAENIPKKAENEVKNVQKESKMPQKMQKRSSFSFLNALDIKKLIGENSEQAMLLLLILILSHDNTCDEYLLYALIYIML